MFCFKIQEGRTAMVRFSSIRILCTLGCIAAAALTKTAVAQTFDIPWHSIDGGGRTIISAGIFELGGTIGQPDTGTLTGGPFTIVGGFWAASLGGTCNLLGDLDRSGSVDLTDLSTLLANFGTNAGGTYAGGDVDLDGDVDITDLSTLLAAFGASCP